MKLKTAKNAEQLQHSAYRVLRPIVRVLRECGLSQRGLVAAAQSACKLYPKVNNRGVWIEHSEYLELADVVTVWVRNVEFINESGDPIKLKIHGRGKSFSYLLRKAHVRLNRKRALQQLESLGAVKVCDRGRSVRLVSHVLITVRNRHFLIAPTLVELRRFAETIEHNVCERPSPRQGRMHRLAQSATVDPAQLPEIERFVRLNGQSFVDSVDEKLTSCAAKTRKARTVKYGVGVYAFVD